MIADFIGGRPHSLIVRDRIRMVTCFDALAAAGQLLAVSVRPGPGTMSERLLVLFQRILAARARRLTRS